MELTRREMLASSGVAALATTIGARLPGAAFAQEGADGSTSTPPSPPSCRTSARRPGDGGGTVTFTGSDPILRSHFRIGTSMALPAMAAAVGAAAIWQERTGEGQDVAIDLREAVYNVNPLLTPIMQMRLAIGAVAAGRSGGARASPSRRRSTATCTRRRSGSGTRSPSCRSAPRTAGS